VSRDRDETETLKILSETRPRRDRDETLQLPRRWPRLKLPRLSYIFVEGPDLAGGRPGAPGGRPGPSSVFGISERDWLSNYRVLKIEGFGGRPPVGGRPVDRGPPDPPPKSGPASLRLSHFMTKKD